MDFSRNKLTILSRLVIGYISIFVLVIAMNSYVIIQMGVYNEITQSVLMTNNKMIEHIGKFSDAFLSQIRYERKFLITKDAAFYNQFLQLKMDCDQYLRELLNTVDTVQVKSFLKNVEKFYQTYELLFGEEVKYLKSGSSYSEQLYQQEKGTAVNLILEELDKSIRHIRKNTDGKMKNLYHLGANTRIMVVVMTGTFLIISIVISFLINRTIILPIAIMKRKTKEIAKGNFTADLDLSSPPEIGELADAFNLMCNKLRELDEMKSDFFNSISHEFRTPLSTITIGVGVLKGGIEKVSKEDQSMILETIDNANNRLVDLVNSILDLSKMEAGMMTFSFEQEEVTPLINRVIEEMGPIVKSKQISLEANITEKLPIIKMDSERILQVLRNLIGNAAKFTPQGGQVKVSAWSTGGGVEVSVADTGPGIPEESLGTIFEKFRQLPSKGSQQIKGTGLGLAIAKQIITCHGGKIWAESRLGTGSTFIFVLPT